MSIKHWNRREFLWQSSQAALSLLVLGRSAQQVVAAQRQPVSVLVLGAGLSGLQTAALLEAQGLSVTVLEARDRVGGRVHTLDDFVGKPEGGGQAFSEKNERLLALTRRLQVPVSPVKLDKEMLLQIRGQTVLPQDWVKSPANHLADREHQLLPPKLLSHYLRPHNPLKDAIAWTTSRYMSLDISLADYLRAQGASMEALRLMQFSASSLLNHLETTSALWALRNDQRSQTRAEQPMRIQGGNSRLPEAIAASLRSPVYLKKVVESLNSSDTQVEVRTRDGTKFRADYAVVTLPFSVLRQIEINPPLQGAQAEAVQSLPYTAVTQIHLTIRQPFWEQDGYPPMMWTDSLLSTLMPQRDAQGRVQTLVFWANGGNAQRLDAMSSSALAQFVQSELKKLRPSMVGNVELSRIVSWGRDPYARGAYSHFAPGQIRHFQSQMAKPWKRIHFAGEHTAISSPGMESALESAERVAKEILNNVIKS